MILHSGGCQVKKGTYWNIVGGDRVDLSQGELLPGGDKERYLRISPWAMLFLGPILGLLYFIFLPIASIVMVVVATVRKSLGWAGSLVSKFAYFEWRPAESYLAGKKKVRKTAQTMHETSKRKQKGG